MENPTRLASSSSSGRISSGKEAALYFVLALLAIALGVPSAIAVMLNAA